MGAEGLKHKLLYTYQNVLERVAQYADANNVPIQKFDTRQMQALLADRRTQNVGDMTLQQDAVVSKTLFTWLWRDEYFPNNNLLKLKAPALKKYVKPRIAPTSEEIHTLLAGIETLERRAQSQDKVQERAPLLQYQGPCDHFAHGRYGNEDFRGLQNRQF